ncbi:transglutaminase domain-containing protein [Microbacterium sp. P01]|uniref:transglutaminase domain-containing protein n=1 Tax=unclassified Microbacterium TaxID=2609290 RepID=UPI003673542F
MSAGGRAARRRQRPRADAGWRQRLLAVVYVLVGLALTTALAWPLFQTPRLIVIAVVAGLSGAGVAVIGQRRRWPLWKRAALLAGVYVVEVVPLAVPSGLASFPAFFGALRDGLIGIIIGWKQLLTLEPPLGDYQAVLVPFFAIALLGTALATGVALIPTRRAGFAVPLVLVSGAFGVAFGLTDPGPSATVLGLTIDAPREVLLSTLLVAASLIWLTWRTRLERSAALAKATSTTATLRTDTVASVAAAARRRVLAGAMVVAALVIGLVAVPAFADVSPRTTLRTGVEPLLVIRNVSSPLADYRGAFAGDRYEAAMFTISGDLDGIDRLAMATLDRWDGQRFSVSSDGRDATRFTRLPGGDPAPGAQTVSVTIGSGYSGIWMPLPAGVQSTPVFEGERAGALTDSFYIDRSSGAGIDIAGSGSARGLREGDGYRVDAPPTTAVALGAPSATSSIDLQSYPQLDAWMQAQEQPRSADGFTELISRLRERGYLSHSLAADETSAQWISDLQGDAPYTFQSSYAGHSTARVEEMFQRLVDQQNRVGPNAAESLLIAAVGDDEQFAAAGALLARAMGYDSRVVVGVKLVDDPADGVLACDGECRGSNLSAWIEVRSPGAGEWTTVDVAPQFRQQPVLVNIGQQLPENPTVPEQADVDISQPPAVQRDDGTTTTTTDAPAPTWWDAVLPYLRIGALTLGTLLLLALPFLVIVIAKVLRRRARRDARVPEVALVGAWEELSDTWADAGIEAVGGTRLERARSAQSAPAEHLARVVDHAVFAQHPPTRDAVADAWRICDDERHRVTSERGVWRRLLIAITPRSFLRSLRLPDARRFAPRAPRRKKAA